MCDEPTNQDLDAIENGAIEEEIIHGVLCWRHTAVDSPYVEYTKEALTTMLVSSEEHLLEVVTRISREALG